MSLAAHFSLVAVTANSVTLSFILTNSSTKTLNICKYYTPLEEICNDILLVTDVSHNQTVEYQGIMAERGSPLPQDFALLAPGQAIGNSAFVIDSDSYDLQSQHTYAVTLRELSMRHKNANSTYSFGDEQIPVVCNVVQFTMQ